MHPTCGMDEGLRGHYGDPEAVECSRLMLSLYQETRLRAKATVPKALSATHLRGFVLTQH